MIEFFNSGCSEEPRNDKLFGLCDDTDDQKAYSTIDKNDEWIAEIRNNRQIDVQFTAIDHCIDIRQPDSQDRESTCDGMLTFDNNIYLFELKNQRADWLPDAIEQLKNTIKLIRENNSDDLKDFTYKKAFASNRKKAHFYVIDAERKKRFFDETTFRLDVRARIAI